MNITDALVAEHAVFTVVFDYVERVSPKLTTLAEARLLAGLIEALLRGHADAEENLAFVALDHVLDHKGRLDQMHLEHHEIDASLKRVHAAKDVAEARRFLAASLRASRKHFRYEERNVFPLMEQMLQHETLTKLGNAWKRDRTALAMQA